MGLSSPILAVLATVFRKKSNLNLAALNAIDKENKDLSKKLAASESQLKLYDPNLFVKQMESLKAKAAPAAELQKAAEDYFFYQNKAITAAALHLAEISLKNEGQDEKSALNEAKRWLSLGLSATPQDQSLNTMMERTNTRLNAEELGLPEEVVEIDPSLNFEQIHQITKDLTAKAQYPLAEFYAKHCISLARAKFGLEHANYGLSYGNLALIYQLASRFADAQETQNIELKILELALGKSHERTILSEIALVTILSALKLDKDAINLAKAVVQKAVSLRGHKNVYVNSLGALGLANLSARQYRDAE